MGEAKRRAAARIKVMKPRQHDPAVVQCPLAEKWVAEAARLREKANQLRSEGYLVNAENLEGRAEVYEECGKGLVLRTGGGPVRGTGKKKVVSDHDKDFAAGVVYALARIIEMYDEPTMAKNLLRESGVDVRHAAEYDVEHLRRSIPKLPRGRD